MKFKDIKQFTSDGNYRISVSFEHLVRWIKDQQEYGLQLNPDFQRGYVWTEKQQIAWLEYAIRGGRSGRELYFNDPNWMGFDVNKDEYHDFVCVDGLQRITAIERFMNNEIQVFGTYFKDYEDPLWFRNNVHVDLVVNDLKSRAEVLQWYIDMNTGGTQHSTEEIDRVKALLEEETIVKDEEKDL